MIYQKLERPPGTPFMRPPPAQRPLWHRAYGDRSLYLLAAGVVLYGFLYRFPNLQLLPAEKPEEYHRELWSRVAGLSWWAWREVDERTRGGAERRFPGVRSGETTEREGQRVMAVRGRSDRLLQSTLLEARAGVWRLFGRGLLSVHQGPGTDRALSVAFHA